MVKKIAKVDDQPLFSNLYTVMSGYYIRQQSLCLTKSQEETVLPLTAIRQSQQKYNLSEPKVFFTDDPTREKKLIKSVFPSLSDGDETSQQELHPTEPLKLPETVSTVIVEDVQSIQNLFQRIMDPLNDSDDARITCSVDAEWNLSRTEGVSIIQVAPHHDISRIYIVKVCLVPSTVQ